MAAKRRKLVEEAFGVWRERSLRKIEVVVVQMKERREKRELLGMWVEASEVSRALSALT